MLSHYDYAKIGDLYLAKDIGELEAICRTKLNVFGIQYFRYSWQYTEMLSQTPQTIIIMSCPAAWAAHYKNMSYGAIDPRCQHVHRSIITAVWEPDLSMVDVHDRERQFWEDSIDFGMGYGATIPIPSQFGGRASLCIAFSPVQAERDDSLSRMPSIESFAFRLHEIVERLTTKDHLSVLNLTKRETEVVKWAAIGKTAHETGRILAISETTVIFHLNNAKRKFGVITKHQLTARAFAAGVI